MIPVQNRAERRNAQVLASLSGIVWEANPATKRFTYVSDNARQVLGYSPQQWLADEDFFMQHVYAADRQLVQRYFAAAQPPQEHIEYRMVKADGGLVWLRNYVSLITEGGEVTGICGIMMDYTSKKNLVSLGDLEKKVLEMNAQPGADARELLDYYVLGIERIYPAMKCSILRVHNDRVYNWSSPSLPSTYVQVIEGLEIGPERGSCGTAAYLREKVIVSDIATDPKWADFRDLALAHDLRACWSRPIIDSAGQVLATFAMYYHTPHSPAAGEEELIDRSAALLEVILENRLYADTIAEMNVMATQAQELANFGTWQWDMETDRVIWSDTLYEMYGTCPTDVPPTYEYYLSRVHPDDVDRVKGILEVAHTSNSETTFEERIVRPGGEVRVLRSWFKVIMGDNGQPSKFLGASIDITDTLEAERRMEQIAWEQSHVVRAPLASLMGLVHLMTDGIITGEEECRQLYSQILTSAGELDQVIRSISYNARALAK